MNRCTFGVILLVALGVALFPSPSDGSCYEAWSRCTGWSSGGTNILWKTCAGRCQLCQGRASGACVQVNGDCGARTQCQCSGGTVPKSTSYIDRMTCMLGL